MPWSCSSRTRLRQALLRPGLPLSVQAGPAQALPSLQVNLRDQDGVTALHRAAQQGMAHVCKFLLANGADPAIKTDDGVCVADVAPPPVQKVLREVPQVGNSDVETRLLEAAKSGELETVKVGQAAETRWLPHPCPTHNGCLTCAPPTQRLCSGQNVNCQDICGRSSTPLHFAAGYNRVEVTDWLLRNGADVNARDKG